MTEPIFQTLKLYGVDATDVQEILTEDIVKFTKTIIERYYGSLHRARASYACTFDPTSDAHSTDKRRNRNVDSLCTEIANINSGQGFPTLYIQNESSPLTIEPQGFNGNGTTEALEDKVAKIRRIGSNDDSTDCGYDVEGLDDSPQLELSEEQGGSDVTPLESPMPIQLQSPCSDDKRPDNDNAAPPVDVQNTCVVMEFCIAGLEAGSNDTNAQIKKDPIRRLQLDVGKDKHKLNVQDSLVSASTVDTWRDSRLDILVRAISDVDYFIKVQHELPSVHKVDASNHPELLKALNERVGKVDSDHVNHSLMVHALAVHCNPQLDVSSCMQCLVCAAAQLVADSSDLKLQHLPLSHFAAILEHLSNVKVPSNDGLRVLGSLIPIVCVCASGDGAEMASKLSSGIIKFARCIYGTCTLDQLQSSLLAVARNVPALPRESFLHSILLYILESLITQSVTATTSAFGNVNGINDDANAWQEIFPDAIGKFMSTCVFDVDSNLYEASTSGFLNLCHNLTECLKTPRFASPALFICEACKILVKRLNSKTTSRKLKHKCLGILCTLSEVIVPCVQSVHDRCSKDLIESYAEYFSVDEQCYFTMEMAQIVDVSSTSKSVIGTAELEAYAKPFWTRLQHGAYNIENFEVEQQKYTVPQLVIYSLLEWAIHEHTLVEELDANVEVWCKIFSRWTRSNGTNSGTRARKTRNINKPTTSASIRSNDWLHVFRQLSTDATTIACARTIVSVSPELDICRCLLLYHLWNQIHNVLWATVIQLLYNSNDHALLITACIFLANNIESRPKLAKLEAISELLNACLGDYVVSVRERALKIYQRILQRCQDPKVLDGKIDRIVTLASDLSWKIRACATATLQTYITLIPVGIDSLTILASVAQRADNISREHPTVVYALYNFLATGLFVINSEFLTNCCNGKMDPDDVSMIQRFVKIILYKMSAFKGKRNPIVDVLNHLASNFSSLVVSKRNARASNDSSGINPSTSAATVYINDIVDKWLNGLLDLFLYRRSNGATFYELAEVLCVFKLFGEACPAPFASHIHYFLPYIKTTPETSMDYSKINIVVLVCNLATIAAPSKEPQDASIDEDVLPLVNFDSPALVRATIQLLSANATHSSYGYNGFIVPIFTRCLHILKSQETNAVYLKTGWILACICEFCNLAGEAFSRVCNNAADFVLTALCEKAAHLVEQKQWNVAGMYIQCVARFLMNLENLEHVNVQTYKSCMQHLSTFALVEPDLNRASLMWLYQLLQLQQTMVNAAIRTATNTLVHSLVPKFLQLLPSFLACNNNSLEASLNHEKDKDVSLDDRCLTRQASLGVQSRNAPGTNVNMTMDRMMVLETLDLIISNRLTSPEPIMPLVFCQLVSPYTEGQEQHATSSMAEHVLKTVIKIDAETWASTFGTCIKELLLSNAVVVFKKTKDAVEALFACIGSLVRIYYESVVVLGNKLANRFTASIWAQISAIVDDSFAHELSRELESHGIGEGPLLGLQLPPCACSGTKAKVYKQLLVKITNAVDPRVLQVQLLQCLYVDILTSVLEALPVRQQHKSSTSGGGSGVGNHQSGYNQVLCNLKSSSLSETNWQNTPALHMLKLKQKSKLV